MCKEVDEPSSSSTEKKAIKHGDIHGQIPEKEETKYPQEPPKKENKEEIIPLPDHSCGVAGDPLKIQSLGKLVDLELSDM